MKPLDGEMMRLLARMPFLDRLEAAAVSGWSRGAVYGSVRRLVGSGLVGSLPHATDLTPLTRRYHLTATGLRLLASSGGTAMEELLRSHPVSTRWRRVLLDRLDALAIIYRVASAVANVAHPISFRWYRAMPIDAAITLPGGRTVGILRQGITSDRSGFSKRLWRLTQMPLPGTVLMLMPDEMRLRYSRRRLARTSVAALLALEREAAAGATDLPVWRLPSVSGAVDLGAAMDRLPPGGVLPVERPLSRISFPRDLDEYGPGEDAPDYLLPALLRPAEKRAIDLLSGWPWLNLNDLAGLMGVSRPRASQIVASLEDFGLVVRTTASGRRLALTDPGLAMLSRRDRTAVGLARKRWSVSPLDEGCPPHWRNVSGRRSRQLLRHIEAHRCRPRLHGRPRRAGTRLLGWETVPAGPTHQGLPLLPVLRWANALHPSRRLRHLQALRAASPGPSSWSGMSERLAPYLRYFSSHRPTDDHGVQPSALVVFEDSLVQTHFLRLAREEMQAARVRVPLWVSHSKAIDALGPLGRAWRAPGDWDSPQALPPQ